MPMSPIETLIVSLVAGAIGGTIAQAIGGVAGTELQHIVRSPELRLENHQTQRLRTEKGSNAAYQTMIRNRGKKAATNCRAILTIEGEFEYPYGASSEVMEHLEIRMSTPLTWSTSDQKTKITLNQDEMSGIELFRISRDGESLKFPSEFGRDRPAIIEVQRKYIDSKTNDQEEGRNPVETVSTESIGISDFNRIDWSKKELNITAENTSGRTYCLEFERAEEGLDVQVKQVQ